MRATRYIADFDSTSSMLYALGRCLRGRDFAGAGVAPSWPRLAGLVNALSRGIREELYRRAGWWEAWPPHRIASVDAEAISRWVVEQYPDREYPGVFIGASHGGAMHLAAAAGMPWLPQTFLLALRRKLDPDDLVADMEWGRAPARELLTRNPDLSLFQMHDPVHDRLMVTYMAYFRIKRRLLGRLYREFLSRRLRPRAAIIIVDCRLRRPVTRLGPRHSYQVGGLGATTVDEYFHGGPRVASFLQEQQAGIRGWAAPSATEEAAEAEWGYIDDWDDEIVEFARAGGHPVRRIVFEDPQDLTAVSADMYREWLGDRGVRPRRLLIENFALVAPRHVLRSGSVPFWLPFNTEPGDRALEQYVETRGPFDEMYLMLLSNGIDAIGLVPVARWRELLRRARRTGRFLGVDEHEFPRDFASFVRYATDLQTYVPVDVPQPEPLTLEALDALAERATRGSSVHWQC